MKRRNFLKGLLSTPAVVAVPALVKKIVEPPKPKQKETTITAKQRRGIKIDENALTEYVMVNKELYKKVEE